MCKQTSTSLWGAPTCALTRRRETGERGRLAESTASMPNTAQTLADELGHNPAYVAEEDPTT